MKPKIDRTRCMGMGMCEVAAPTVFEVGDDGFSHVINDDPSASERTAIEKAVRDCPTGAITVEDSGGSDN